MNGKDKPPPPEKSEGEEPEDELRRSVRLRRERRDFWQREGERPLGRNLAMIGALGWLVVVPTLLGVALGRWLDRSLESGIFWTGSLIFAGLCIGCYMAWKRIEKE